jgi:alanine-glyoxylate transaminase/serine-glyoxylate transaminase/serine-pyruvate transaminase
VSGTGSAGMEAAVANLIEPGDFIMVGVNGYFGERICEMTSRYGANVHRIDKTWGDVFTPQEIDDALKAQKVKVVALVHAETSTGALTHLENMAEVVHKHGALLLVDCVTSLGGIPVRIDEWDIDIAYSGTQKCLSCPPGLAPITIGPRAQEVLHQRKTKVANWYLDMTMLEHYWGDERTYHHTAPISMNFGLREALRLVQEEGLEARYLRHQANSEFLWTELEKLNLKLVVLLDHRLPSVTTVEVPQDINDVEIRKRLLEEYNIEIAGGLGAFKGKVWRIGLMGYSSRRENVALLISALSRLL